MPIDSKLPSPAELLYQCQLRTTILAKIHNSDPAAPQVHKQINAHSESAKAQADKHSKTLVPLYAGQPVATYNTLQKIRVLFYVFKIQEIILEERLWYLVYNGRQCFGRK